MDTEANSTHYNETDKQGQITRRQAVIRELRASGLSAQQVADKLNISRRQVYRDSNKWHSVVDNNPVIEQARQGIVDLAPKAVTAYKDMLKKGSRDRYVVARDVLTTHGAIKQKVDHSHAVEIQTIEQHQDRLRRAQELSADDYEVHTPVAHTPKEPEPGDEYIIIPDGPDIDTEQDRTIKDSILQGMEDPSGGGGPPDDEGGEE